VGCRRTRCADLRTSEAQQSRLEHPRRHRRWIQCGTGAPLSQTFL